MKRFAEEVRKIEMSAEMQERIRKNCYERMEEENMKKSNKNIFQKPMVAVAALALCLCVTGASALAATGKLQGYFKDITRWDGAVTGTAYEQATDEVGINVTEVTDRVKVSITLLEAEKVPYSEFEALGIQSYQILDRNGKAVVKGAEAEAVLIKDGQAEMWIPLEDVPDGEYTLVISKLTGSKKAEQPLVVSGNWVCSFTKGDGNN